MLDDYTDEFVPEIGGISLREYENIVNEIENQPSWRAIADQDIRCDAITGRHRRRSGIERVDCAPHARAGLDVAVEEIGRGRGGAGRRGLLEEDVDARGDGILRLRRVRAVILEGDVSAQLMYR